MVELEEEEEVEVDEEDLVVDSAVVEDEDEDEVKTKKTTRKVQRIKRNVLLREVVECTFKMGDSIKRREGKW